VIDLILRGARVEDDPRIVDVGIDQGRVAARAPRLDLEGRTELELRGRIVLPAFVNPHLHLDKAFVGGLAPSGLMLDGVEYGRRLKSTYMREDIQSRARRGLDLAIRHGVTALRACADVDPIVGTLCVEALVEIRDEYHDRIDVQVLAFPQEGFLGVPGMASVMRQALDAGADVIGGRPHGDPPHAVDFDRHIEELFTIADGRPIDMSVDAIFPPQPIDPRGLGVYRLALAALRHARTAGQITAHHVLALSAVELDAAEPIIDAVRDASLNITTLPTSNLFTEGRLDACNPRRGLTRVKDFWRAGVNVAIGTDNLDDTYLPFVNGDPLVEAHVCACAAHLGTPSERRALLDMLTYNGARTLGLHAGYGTDIGKRADLVVLDTRHYLDVVTTRPEKLYVLKAGRIVAHNRLFTELAGSRSANQLKHENPA
jgi:cytosine deaminase